MLRSKRPGGNGAVVVAAAGGNEDHDQAQRHQPGADDIRKHDRQENGLHQ